MLEGDEAAIRDGADDLGSGLTGEEAIPEPRSLAEDLEALYEDGKTYAEAELAYQKTRARYVAQHGKAGLGYGLLAVFFLHMALIGLTVGAILTLIPVVGPLFATLIVVGVVLALVVILGLMARSRIGRIGKAFEGDDA